MFLYKAKFCVSDDCTYAYYPCEVFISENDDNALKKALTYGYDKDQLVELEKLEEIDGYKISLTKS